MARSAKQVAAQLKAAKASAAKRKRITKAEFNSMPRMAQLKADVPTHWKFGGPPVKPRQNMDSAYTAKLKADGVAHPNHYIKQAAKKAVQSVKPRPVR